MKAAEGGCVRSQNTLARAQIARIERKSGEDFACLKEVLNDHAKI